MPQKMAIFLPSLQVTASVTITTAGNETRKAVYEHITEVCSHNHWWHGKAGSITYLECVSVALLSSVHYTCAVLLSMPCFPTLSRK
jgi:hypothetical protein